jgi:glycosyltransferase involved in cell wall biosynthesis
LASCRVEEHHGKYLSEGARVNKPLEPGSIMRVAMAAQRLNLPVPVWMRRRVGDWVRSRARGSGTAPLLDDWSQPLLRPSSGTMPVLEHTASLPGRYDTHVDRYERSIPALRCLVVTSDLDAGGMDEMVAMLARGFRRLGWTIAVLHVLSDPPPPVPTSRRIAKALLQEGIDVRELHERQAIAWLRDWQPDVVGAHGAPECIVQAAQRAGVPYVETLHGMHSFFGADWAKETRRAAGVSRIVAVSELVRQQYLQGNPDFPARHIRTIPNGVDRGQRRLPDRSAARSSLGLQDEFLFVCLARQCVQKNIYGLVSAFSEVARNCSRAHLVIAGRVDDPVYFAQVSALRDRQQHARRIHLRDHLQEPSLLLAAGDAFVLNSFFEGWSLASMEALCAGMPVVLSNVGGAVEQVGDDPRRGVVVPNPAGDALRVNWQSMRIHAYRPQVNQEALVQAMLEMATGQRESMAHRDALRQESERRFRCEPCVRAHADLLREAAMECRRSACGSGDGMKHVASA